jgi:S1-C subfamily serine protease
MDTVWVVRDGLSSFPARVVHFDPERDVAVLDVSGQLGPSLALAARSEHGDTGALLGHPGGGFLAWTQASVDRMITFGLDIYDRSANFHRVLVVIANAYPGDSGGPIVSAEGEVLGMVVRAGVSKVFAVPADVLIKVLDSVSTGSRRVSTGSCLAH